MDREFIVEVSRRRNNPKHEDVVEILKNYCLEHKKDEADTMQFISVLLSSVVWYSAFSYALDYYENKYHIIKLINNNQILKIY